MQAMSEDKQYSGMFRRLSTLSFNSALLNNPLIALVLSPSTKSLRINMDVLWGDTAITDVCRILLPNLIPKLRALSIKVGDWEYKGVPSSTLLTALASISHLVSVDIDTKAIDGNVTEVFTQLLQVPILRANVRFCPRSKYKISRTVCNTVSRVTELNAEPWGESGDGHLHFFNICVSGLLSHLRTLVIHAYIDGRNADTEKQVISYLLRGISCFHQLVSFDVGILTDNDSTMTFDELFSPFLTLGKIQQAIMWLPRVSYSVKRLEIERIASSWPDIQGVNFTASSQTAPPSKDDMVALKKLGTSGNINSTSIQEEGRDALRHLQETP